MAIPAPIDKIKKQIRKHEIYNNKLQNLKRIPAQQNIISNLSTNLYKTKLGSLLFENNSSMDIEIKDDAKEILNGHWLTRCYSLAHHSLSIVANQLCFITFNI